MAIALVST